MSDVIQEKEIDIEDQCDTDELDTDKTSKNRIIDNLKSAGVMVIDASQEVETS